MLGSSWDTAANLKGKHYLHKKNWWQGTISYSFQVYYKTQWTFQQEVSDWKKQENLLRSGPYISSKRAGLKYTSCAKWDNKSRIAEAKNIIRGFRCGKNVKLNGLDFIITKNLEKFISESFEWGMAPVLTWGFLPNERVSSLQQQFKNSIWKQKFIIIR